MESTAKGSYNGVVIAELTDELIAKYDAIVKPCVDLYAGESGRENVSSRVGELGDDRVDLIAGEFTGCGERRADTREADG